MYPPSPGDRTKLTHSPLQRNLNNAFAYDLVPSVSVVAAALKAARRVNDFATAVRVFEGTLYFLCLEHQQPMKNKTDALTFDCEL